MNRNNNLWVSYSLGLVDMADFKMTDFCGLNYRETSVNQVRINRRGSRMAYDFRKMFEGEVEGDESLNGVEDVYRLYKC